MAEEEYSLRETPVRRRDETPIGLFGLTFPDMGILAGVFILARFATHSTLATVACLAAAYLYVSKLKEKLPERFLSKFINFNMEKHTVYRALGRDTLWRPPIVEDSKEKNPWAAFANTITATEDPFAEKKEENRERPRR